jgi:hypothetical protein
MGRGRARATWELQCRWSRTILAVEPGSTIDAGPAFATPLPLVVDVPPDPNRENQELGRYDDAAHSEVV